MLANFMHHRQPAALPDALETARPDRLKAPPIQGCKQGSEILLGATYPELA